jgi:serine/arginine repetitive matrix protein 2
MQPKKKKTPAKQPVIVNGNASAVDAPVDKKPRMKRAAEVPIAEPITKTAAKKPSLKKSMRDGAASAPPLDEKPVASMRTSMRDGTPKGIGTRDSVRHKQQNSLTGMPLPEPRAALQKKHRPMSSAGIVGQPEYAAGGAMRARPASIAGSPPSAAAIAKAAPPLPKPALRRQMSDGSDSDSSFRRARRNRAQNNGGRYSMRHSMRASSVAEGPRSALNTEPADRASRAYSVRSLSPAGNSQRPGTMRTSLRSASQTPAERAKSPTRSLFGRKSKAPPFATPVPAKPASRFKSRFNDSSDEEDNAPRGYRSRFADSDSEEEEAAVPLDLTPVRGIPRRADDGDSTELEDSEEERKSKQMAKKAQQSPPPPLTIPKQNTEGSALTNGTLRHNGSGREAMSPTREGNKKRSFFGSLGRRKDKNSKVAKIDFESAARRDTSLERSQAERNALKTMDETPTDGTGTIGSPVSPKSPKLQRRNPQRMASDSWPLPPPIPDSPSGPVRPNTSDGTRNTARPQLGGRGVSAVSASTGKKKRFPMLRKAFGLHD